MKKDRIASFSQASSDPLLSMNNMERFLTSNINIDSDDILKILINIFSSSQFLSNILIRFPEYYKWLFIDGYIHKNRSYDDFLNDIRKDIYYQMDTKEFYKILRRFRHKEILRIGSRDLSMLSNLEDTMKELSDLASASLQISYEFFYDRLKEDYGIPTVIDENGNKREGEFVIIGLGKLGGYELNMSSDIDIMYLYSSDRGETDGKKNISLHEFYTKFSEMISSSIRDITDDGFVFRVDLRLRPEGIKGDLVNSLRSTEIYYESWGGTWERAAMIKARPVAGSMELGKIFLNLISPFVYRKFLDYSAIEEIKEMKRKLDINLKDDSDVKLGPGGIREIEFFIQAIQLIYGGKDPSIREKNTLISLNKLRERKYIEDEEYEILYNGYKFLRNLEHKIQIFNDRQTHSLPKDEKEIEKLAKRMGFSDSSTFIKRLGNNRNSIRSIYNKLFYKPKKDISPKINMLLGGSLKKDEAINILIEYGFKDPERANNNLVLLRDGSPFSHFSEKSKRILNKIAPFLLSETLSSPDPDMALNNLERFISKIGARTTFYSLLLENPSTLKLLIELFGTSDFLSKFLINHSELLDKLVSPSLLYPKKEYNNLYKEITDILKNRDYEESLDLLRRFKNEEILRIGINDISHNLSIWEVEEELSILAEAILRRTLNIALDVITKRYGKLDFQFAIFGLGKLGGREINYSSDLDIIFIYSNNGNSLEYFIKLAQRVISILTNVTKEGFLYKIDTRLRPSGNAGPLVSSLEAFERYHRVSSQAWEKQALIKARFIAGDKELGDKVNSIINASVYSNAFSSDVVKEIDRLRMRMENELGNEDKDKYNIKFGKGGIVDIEFIVQLLQLKYGYSNPRVQEQNTLKALSLLYNEGIINKNNFEFLKNAYEFSRKLENGLRLIYDRIVSDFDIFGDMLTKVSKKMGYENSVDIIKDYNIFRERVRDIYSSFFKEGEMDGRH